MESDRVVSPVWRKPMGVRVPSFTLGQRVRPYLFGWFGLVTDDMTSPWAQHTHPAVATPSDLSLGQRAADRLRNGMGSWKFVIGALVFLAVWMISSGLGIDPSPFILLNLVLSCLAALQGAILLIAAKRQDEIAARLAHHDYEVNQEALELVRELRGGVDQMTCAQRQGKPCSCAASNIYR